MTTSELQDLFGSIRAASAGEEGVLAAVEFPRYPNHRAALDRDGKPCLLIRMPPGSRSQKSIRLENLEVVFDTPCLVSTVGSSPERDVFTIIRCTGGRAVLERQFIALTGHLIDSLGQQPTVAQVDESVSALVELFRAMSLPSSKAVQGLWAELLLMDLAVAPPVLASAWHSAPNERHDFVLGDQRIEVKSCSRYQRRHYFSLSQLELRVGSLVVVSICTERVGNGVSLQDLAWSVRSRLTTVESISRFDRIFHETLGASWEQGLDDAFDYESARASILFYQAQSVPRPRLESSAVSEVRFCADLAGLPNLSVVDLRDLGGLYRAAIANSWTTGAN